MSQDGPNAASLNLDILNIALVQMTSVDSLATNLQSFEQIFRMIEKLEFKTQESSKLSTDLSKPSLELICFPENCLFLRIKDSDPIEGFQLTHSCFLWLGEWAKKLQTHLHLGSVPLIIEGKLYNSSIWIGRDGRPQVGYQKIHLFDIELAGQKPIRESDVFQRGDSHRIHQIKNWSIGESICYDLRFAELYSKYAYEGVDLILVPAAFLPETGKAHWDVLLRARAIESQSYVVASAQAGKHQSVEYPHLTRQTHGNSLIINPWGEVEFNLGMDASVQVHALKKAEINKVRKQIPMSAHRQGRV